MAGLVTAGLVLAVPAGPAANARQRPIHYGSRVHYGARVHYGPWSMWIPSIGVNAPVAGLSAGRSGYAPVPSLSDAGEIGWWRFSARPGRSGNAVFVGHVDTYLGPAVFYNLYRLVPGNVVWVFRPPLRPVRYAVRWVKEVPKGDLATSVILGRTRLHRAWLITCGGAFNYATRSYVDNIVVSAQQIR
ncbi:MAG TPA: class F sortase [Streptosporangiaceae bacterium]|nr:class F sortase [Streptosporangiaceae bacterium]